MNLDLLKEHIESCDSIELPAFKEDGSNANDFFCVDLPVDREFAQNYGGYPRSDIAIINEQQNLAVQKALLDKLNVITPDTSNAGRSDAEIMLSHRSKYQQTATEMQSWLQDQLAVRDAKRAQLAREMAAKQAQQQNPSVVRKDVTPQNE